MASITIDSYQTWFRVNTVHGSNLEHHLAELEEAEDVGRQSYQGDLYRRIEEALKGSPGSLQESSHYGDLIFLIQAPTIGELQLALLLCEAAVKKWVFDYLLEEA